MINWDTDYLEGQIRNLMASMNYASPAKITFPVMYSKVIFKIGREPLIKPFDNIVKWFSQKEPSKTPKREVANTEIQAIWPYATAMADQADHTPRKCAVQTEQQYWSAWKGAIANAVLSKRSGFVSTEDRVEALMGFKLAPPKDSWGGMHS